MSEFQLGRPPRPQIDYKLIRRRRRKLGLTQKQLGERASLTQGAVSFIERHKYRPTFEVRKRLAEALGLTEAQVSPPEADPFAE